MDTSKKYIEMCRKADEIQQQWNEDTRQEGDFFAENSSIDVFYSCPEEDNLTYVDYPVWLPRLDQLFGLITDENHRGEVVRTLKGFAYFAEEGEGRWHSFNKSHLPKPSPEQLALVFVMQLLFQKEWDGNQWQQCGA